MVFTRGSWLATVKLRQKHSRSDTGLIFEGSCGPSPRPSQCHRRTDGERFVTTSGNASRKANLLYLLACFLAAVAFSFHGFYSAYVVHFYMDPINRVRAPFIYGPERTVESVTEEADKAGLRTGDQIQAIDQRPFTGNAVFANALNNARPGNAMDVTVRRSGRDLLNFQILLQPFSTVPYGLQDWLIGIIAFIFVPAIALLSGFAVVALRPFDRRAWLVLALLVSFSHVYFVQGWDGPLR